jgi:hypothetical protein
MAVGDAWEISLAVPFPNSRCTEWQASVSDGPVGWFPFGTSTVNIRSDGASAQSNMYISGTVDGYSQLFNNAGPASISSLHIRASNFFQYKSDGDAWFSASIYRSDGTYITSISNQVSASASWSLEIGVNISLPQSSGSYRALYIANVGAGWAQVSQVGLRYIPNDWHGTRSYEIMSGVPVPDGLFYGAMPNGKWRLAASYDRLSDVNYQTLRRYRIANTGGLDGIPRPVCIRPYLEDGTIGPYVDFIIGNFTEFSFAPDTLGSTHSGSFVLEEW